MLVFLSNLEFWKNERRIFKRYFNSKRTKQKRINDKKTKAQTITIINTNHSMKPKTLQLVSIVLHSSHATFKHLIHLLFCAKRQKKQVYMMDERRFVQDALQATTTLSRRFLFIVLSFKLQSPWRFQNKRETTSKDSFVISQIHMETADVRLQVILSRLPCFFNRLYKSSTLQSYPSTSKLWYL